MKYSALHICGIDKHKREEFAYNKCELIDCKLARLSVEEYPSFIYLKAFMKKPSIELAKKHLLAIYEEIYNEYDIEYLAFDLDKHKINQYIMPALHLINKPLPKYIINFKSKKIEFISI